MNRFLRAFVSKWLGNRGETAAVRHLKSAGIRVITTNYRTSRGEIDIVARENDSLVFVEVKTRKRGNPSEFVTLEKQRRLTSAAQHFLSRHNLYNKNCRFDVVAIVWDDELQPPMIEHIRNAFEATDRGPSYS